MNLKKIITFIICLSIPLMIGSIAGIITSKEIDEWFYELRKPEFNPPNEIFGPVWTILYILMGISLYVIWVSPENDNRKKALWTFGIQLFLNFWWSIIFFSFHQIFIAIITIVALWAFIFYMIILFKKIKPAAAYLNIPYLLWVSFATILNISIWWLNLR